MFSKSNVSFLYLGSSNLSALLFEFLINDGFKFSGLVCQPDKPEKRGNKLKKCATKIVAEKYKIPVYDPLKLRLDFHFINEIKCDALLCFSYGQIIPNEVLNFPKLECFNIHPSLLPKYRGASPIFESIKNGDEVSGVTLMKMIDKMDAGKIFDVIEFKIDSETYLEDIEKIILEDAKKLCQVSIFKVLNKEIVGEEQDESKATFCGKIKNEVEHISLNGSSKNIFNLCRALGEKNSPYVFNNEGKRIKIIRAKFSSKQYEPCNLFYEGKQLYFSNSKGECLEILKIQNEGKNVLSSIDFINGNKNKLPMRIS